MTSLHEVWWQAYIYRTPVPWIAVCTVGCFLRAWRKLGIARDRQTDLVTLLLMNWPAIQSSFIYFAHEEEIQFCWFFRTRHCRFASHSAFENKHTALCIKRATKLSYSVYKVYWHGSRRGFAAAGADPEDCTEWTIQQGGRSHFRAMYSDGLLDAWLTLRKSRGIVIWRDILSAAGICWS